jgi:hypothetical protein
VGYWRGKGRGRQGGESSGRCMRASTRRLKEKGEKKPMLEIVVRLVVNDLRTDSRRSQYNGREWVGYHYM